MGLIRAIFKVHGRRPLFFGELHNSKFHTRLLVKIPNKYQMRRLDFRRDLRFAEEAQIAAYGCLAR